MERVIDRGGFLSSWYQVDNWNNNYFDRSCPGSLIEKRPCLVMKRANCMNPYGIVENILIPSLKDNVEVAVCIYHLYEREFSMTNELIIKICDMSVITE